MDGLENFKLLRERLDSCDDKNTLMQLALIRIKALEELRALIASGATVTLNKTTYSAETWHSISADEKERALFTLGHHCLLSANANIADGFLDHDIQLNQLNILSNCAMLHVLAMIENITDGNGEPQFFTPRYNFNLTNDQGHVFQSLIAQIPLFYPKVLVGKVISK